MKHSVVRVRLPHRPGLCPTDKRREGAGRCASGSATRTIKGARNSAARTHVRRLHEFDGNATVGNATIDLDRSLSIDNAP